MVDAAGESWAMGDVRPGNDTAGAASPVMVRHALGRYPVYVEPGGLGRLEALVAEYLGASRAVMIADASVHALLQAGRLGRARWAGAALTFPPGEPSKTREQWARLTDLLLDQGYGRDTGIVALGGGVAGDLAGFVAATYMRGLRYVQVPTSLLAMLDASVGGKTGVDTPEGKNLIGAFHPPAAVLADPRALATLPERELRGGMAEAVKHGLIADAGYFEWMEHEADALLQRDEAALAHLVRRSVEIKAEVVSGDERESGRRAILNAGHTVAHALERVTAYGIPHGEAVALGLVAECALAEGLGVAASGLGARVAALLSRLGLPVRLAEPVAADALVSAMATDKKNRAARVRFALPSVLGSMDPGDQWTREAPGPAIREALGGIA
ncbi:MAG TPA: 3-dehydroquinate synthase [Gemmatimonadales bacterium]|nr:3-dehydroquinate synthase [Gemmatimonadales bacterium]